MLVTLAGLIAAAPLSAQTVTQRVARATAITRKVTIATCRRGARSDEIVVCAATRDSPYRLPPDVRAQLPDENTRAGRTVAVERFDLIHNDYDPLNTAPLRAAGLTDFENGRERYYSQHPEKGRIGGGVSQPVPEVGVVKAAEVVVTELPPGVAGPR